ncbi:MAG TPA: hypothetical protein VEA44_16525 [Caulobacter sp.]|nr:hypothetical protein [Caulobacter sp.]
MIDKPPESEEKAAEAEFQRVLGNLAKMPHKPHVNGPATDRGSKKTGDAPVKNRRPPEAR